MKEVSASMSKGNHLRQIMQKYRCNTPYELKALLQELQRKIEVIGSMVVHANAKQDYTSVQKLTADLADIEVQAREIANALKSE